MYITESLITKELNRFFPTFEFKTKYKKELLSRIIFFVISQLNKKREELSIEEYEKFLINFLFYSKRKTVDLESLIFVEDDFFKNNLEELFLMFNPLHYNGLEIKNKDYEDLFLYFLLKERNNNFIHDNIFYVTKACNLSPMLFNKKFYSFSEGSKRSNLFREKIKLLTKEERIKLIKDNKDSIFFSIDGIEHEFCLKDKNISLSYLFSRFFKEQKHFDVYINKEKRNMNDLQNIHCSIYDLFELIEMPELISSTQITNLKTNVIFKNKDLEIEFVINFSKKHDLDRMETTRQAEEMYKRDCYRVFMYTKRMYNRVLSNLLYIDSFLETLEDKILEY